jgi:hypothetical protein
VKLTQAFQTLFEFASVVVKTSSRCSYCDESVTSICQRKDTKPIEDVDSIRDDEGQLVNVTPIDTLGYGTEKRPGIGTEFLKLGGGEVNHDSVFNACTGDLGEPTEEMGRRCWELVASDEPTTLAKLLLDAVVMEGSRCDQIRLVACLRIVPGYWRGINVDPIKKGRKDQREQHIAFCWLQLMNCFLVVRP